MGSLLMMMMRVVWARVGCWSACKKMGVCNEEVHMFLLVGTKRHVCEVFWDTTVFAFFLLYRYLGLGHAAPRIRDVGYLLIHRSHCSYFGLLSVYLSHKCIFCQSLKYALSAMVSSNHRSSPKRAGGVFE
jgi:hypothetical protein